MTKPETKHHSAYVLNYSDVMKAIRAADVTQARGDRKPPPGRFRLAFFVGDIEAVVELPSSEVSVLFNAMKIGVDAASSATK